MLVRRARLTALRQGITMPAEQFAKVVELLPHLEAVLREKGDGLPRPRYDAEHVADAKGEASSDDSLVDLEPKKRNIEVTSDEED
jgi:hypothetical protein